MPSRSITLNAIRAELSWVAEMHIPINAVAVTSGAATKRVTGQEHVPVLSQRNSGRSAGNITISCAANTNGAEVELAAT
jgi:hypothetical protein